MITTEQTKEPKRIIWAGGDLFYEKEVIEVFHEKIPELRFDHKDSIGNVLDAINSGAYQGMYVANLWIPLMIPSPERLDLTVHEVLVRHGSGLYVIRKAKEKNLTVVARPESVDEVSDISDLGAVVCNTSGEMEKLFRQFFLETTKSSKRYS